MLVRSDGGIAWGLTLTSGVDETQGPAPNWGAWPGAQIPQDCEPVVQIQVQLQTPTNSTTAPTTAQVQAALSTIQDDLDSMNEISEMTSVRLQMLMDMRSKLLRTVSDIEKTESDTSIAITQNLKL